MKILYAIQGTGNGHVSRARDIIPVLSSYGELDILMSGDQVEVNLNHDIRYRYHGLGFVFGKKGGVDIWKTLKQLRPIRLVSDIWRLEVHKYDLVVSDFEPVSAWSCLFKLKKCVGLSHQSAVIHKASPKPQRKDWFGHFVLKYYAPVNSVYGFHFHSYAENIFSPIIRREVRQLNSEEGDVYVVYLPSYGDERIIEVLSELNASFQIFSKHAVKEYRFKNGQVVPISNERYLKSLSRCKGAICGAGFEGPAEVLFLNKKLLVIPMRGQYEQNCNAVALQKLGVLVLNRLHIKYRTELESFIKNEQMVDINYPDDTQKIVSRVVKENVRTDQPTATDSFSFS